MTRGKKRSNTEESESEEREMSSKKGKNKKFRVQPKKSSPESSAHTSGAGKEVQKSVDLLDLSDISPGEALVMRSRLYDLTCPKCATPLGLHPETKEEFFCSHCKHIWSDEEQIAIEARVRGESVHV